MAFRGSFSRSLFATARSSLRSPAPLPRQRPRSPTAPRPERRFLNFAPSRPVAALGCSQSLLPLHSVVAAARLTSHLSLNARACCELSQERHQPVVLVSGLSEEILVHNKELDPVSIGSGDIPSQDGWIDDPRKIMSQL